MCKTTFSFLGQGRRGDRDAGGSRVRRRRRPRPPRVRVRRGSGRGEGGGLDGGAHLRRGRRGGRQSRSQRWRRYRPARLPGGFCAGGEAARAGVRGSGALKGHGRGDCLGVEAKDGRRRPAMARLGRWASAGLAAVSERAG
jgi:hypothetical protein